MFFWGGYFSGEIALPTLFFFWKCNSLLWLWTHPQTNMEPENHNRHRLEISIFGSRAKSAMRIGILQLSILFNYLFMNEFVNK